MGKKPEKASFNPYPFFIEIGFRISIPLVVFVLVGIWLDRSLHTWHLFLFLGIFLSLFTSAFGIYKTLSKIESGDK